MANATITIDVRVLGGDEVKSLANIRMLAELVVMSGGASDRMNDLQAALWRHSNAFEGKPR